MRGPIVNALPETLQSLVNRRWGEFTALLTPELELALAPLPDPFWEQLARAWAGSDFVCDQLLKQPALLVDLLPDLERAYTADAYDCALRQRLQTIDSEEGLQQQLRRFRNREMVRIIWRDLNRLSAMEETTGDLSNLADSCIREALELLYRWACERWGTPYSRGDDKHPPSPQRLVVVAMGKLGARELNLSSDIDLIFTFEGKGETQGGRKSLDNQDFFTRLGQKLIQALDAATVDGFVFRVDMRLRPYGESGPLAPSFSALEEYYQDQGREWERYAMIKARVVAGDPGAAGRLQAMLKPFVYRRYLDYSAFDSLRAMKAMINREVRRKQLDDNVKLGPGGIREVEFIAQAFQLIRGGRDSRLQERELAVILPLLPETVGMPEEAVRELHEAYRFLRNTEHAIQAIADRQTQELPDDDLGRARIALAMGCQDWADFVRMLGAHRSRVRHHFAEVIAPQEETEAEEDDLHDWVLLWRGSLGEREAQTLLQDSGYDDPASVLARLAGLRSERRVVQLQQVARERLDQAMPRLLREVAGCETPAETFGRTLLLIEAVLRRSAYLVLLVENPAALRQLVRLCDASTWFAEQLARQPILLDELLDPTSLYAPPDKERLQEELRLQLLRIPQEDTEQQMEALRYFKNAHGLRVAAAEVTGALPLMKVSDYLTYIAEVVLEQVLRIAWNTLVEKHGVPQRAPGEPCDPGFIIVGYGKLGGIELGYGSDLDLVFIHHADPNLETDGKRAIATPVFYTRLGQRIIHILNTFTPSGQLYDVDMRLRPSGASGLLVTSLKAFREYQLKEAWNWEHQALVRARVVAGDRVLQTDFEAVRQEVLAQERDREVLRQQVREMRAKMRESLGSGEGADAEERFHLKHDRGGIVDIEFMVQYGVLAHAHDYPEILRYTDNIRLLDGIEQAGLLSAEDADWLREAYKALRASVHRLALQERGSEIAATELADYRAAVVRIWERWLESPAS